MDNHNNTEFVAKVIVVGESGVGKTSLLYKLKYDRFQTTMSTVCTFQMNHTNTQDWCWFRIKSGTTQQWVWSITQYMWYSW